MVKIEKLHPDFVKEIRECIEFNQSNTDPTVYQVMRFDSESYMIGCFVHNYLLKQSRKSF